MSQPLHSKKEPEKLGPFGDKKISRVEFRSERERLGEMAYTGIRFFNELGIMIAEKCWKCPADSKCNCTTGWWFRKLKPNENLVGFHGTMSRQIGAITKIGLVTAKGNDENIIPWYEC